MTIANLIKNIKNKSYLLPDIQRDYVWKEEQIINLFDSIMQDYPLGMILLWELDGDVQGFYTFLESTNDKKKQYDGGSIDLKAVLDGQQRLTSLYLATYGDYNGKKLYFNASYKDEESEENVYEFDFKSKEELGKYTILKDGNHNDFAFVYKDDCDNVWVKVSYMLDISENELEKLGEELNLKNKEYKNCDRLRDRFAKKDIPEHTITKDNSNKALDIFVRVNSGGRKLEKSDLLFSLLISETQNLKSKIEELLSDINDEYKNKSSSLNSLDKDVFLRTCLCIFANSVKYDLKTFRETDIIEQIENNFKSIENSLKSSVKFLDRYCGYGDLKGLSFYPIVLVAFVMYHQKNMDKLIDSSEPSYAKLREDLISFIQISIIVGTYSGSSDTTLGQIRDVIKNDNYTISIDNINSVLSDNKKAILRDSKIDDILDKYQYTVQSHKNQMFYILSLLNPQIDITAAQYDIDHIYPKSISKNNSELKKLINSLGNTQLLFFRDNRKKSDECPLEWMKKLKEYEKNKIIKGNLITENKLVSKDDIEGIKEFIEDRKKELKKKLKERFKA
ncbi:MULTISPECIES: DUF262 domain-containing protein [unclassified Campylobacter]|uniref:DUF262 domain-containing protein n=1 Tax=unclassified Campylobacter TaxID=2593542 RepID=UPI001BD9408C|nr:MULTISPECIES: DUF262 domain-containing protein [unclassified Campylobacter]MBT0879775.1 DUF262 domain-containing protein [Campylobacter sp. 2018MI27]MBT0885115.1 DUF262 domain-containing protein [Campylobacter sp. 2018MI10]